MKDSEMSSGALGGPSASPALTRSAPPVLREHTPGPWYVYDGSLDNDYWYEGRTIGSQPDGTRVCDVTVLRNEEQAAADARLIAAAPEMFEALTRIAALCDDDNGAHWLTKNDTTRALARAALAKAQP